MAGTREQGRGRDSWWVVFSRRMAGRVPEKQLSFCPVK